MLKKALSKLLLDVSGVMLLLVLAGGGVNAQGRCWGCCRRGPHCGLNRNVSGRVAVLLCPRAKTPQPSWRLQTRLYKGFQFNLLRCAG